MQGRSFAVTLDDALARLVPEAPSAAAAAWAWRSEPPLGSAFLFARPLTSAVPRWAAADERRPRRPAHRFTQDQRLAFDRMVLLGADLEESFTADELRREYRRLARRFHPDAHPGCSALERAQLARCFVEATEDYRRLQQVVDTRH